MSEVVDVLDAFSNLLKIGWVVWLAWGIGLVFWYRRERKPSEGSLAPAAPEARKRAAVNEPDDALVVRRLVTPEPVMESAPPVADAMSRVADAMPPVAEGLSVIAEVMTPLAASAPQADEPLLPKTPDFDPSTGVVEILSSTDDDMDSIVADFERGLQGDGWDRPESHGGSAFSGGVSRSS